MYRIEGESHISQPRIKRQSIRSQSALPVSSRRKFRSQPTPNHPIRQSYPESSIVLLLSSGRVFLAIVAPHPFAPAATSLREFGARLVTSLGHMLVTQILKLSLTFTSVEQALGSRSQKVLKVWPRSIIGRVRWRRGWSVFASGFFVKGIEESTQIVFLCRDEGATFVA